MVTDGYEPIHGAPNGCYKTTADMQVPATSFAGVAGTSADLRARSLQKLRRMWEI